MKSKQKWFYPMQERLKEKMRKAFPNWKASLQYQVITKDRVIEGYVLAINEKGNHVQMVEAHLIKVSNAVMLFEMKTIN